MDSLIDHVNDGLPRHDPHPWWQGPLLCPITGRIRAIHVVLDRERLLGMHVLDVGGLCPWGPRDANSPADPFQTPMWVHKQLERLS